MFPANFEFLSTCQISTEALGGLFLSKLSFVCLVLEVLSFHTNMEIPSCQSIKTYVLDRFLGHSFFFFHKCLLVCKIPNRIFTSTSLLARKKVNSGKYLAPYSW